MKRALCVVLMLIGLLTFAPPIFADGGQTKGKEPKELSREKKAFRNYSGEGSSSITSFCLEGYVFVVLSADNSNNFSIMQVYKEMNGKSVPKKCD
jgi:hypothetical protein